MTKGTVIYIGGFELPDKNAAAHRVLANGKIMRDLGYRVVLVGVDKSSAEPRPVLDSRGEVQGFETWAIPYPASRRDWINYLSHIDNFQAVAASYSDLCAVICYNYPALALNRLRNYCHSRGVRVISDCTEWAGTEGENLVYKILKGTDTWLRMHVLHRRMDGLIVISKYLEDYYASVDNLIRVPPLIDLAEAKWQQELPAEDDSLIRFVYAGDGARDKDRLNLVVEALGRLDSWHNYRFYVVGVSREKYLQNYRDHAPLLEQLGERVSFLGRLPHLESLRYVQLADYNLFYRVSNRLSNAGFPTKLVESMTCGVPVITSPTSNIAEYLRPGINGLYLEGDISSTLEQVLKQDREQIKAMKSRIVRETFDYHAFLDQFRALLEPQREPAGTAKGAD